MGESKKAKTILIVNTGGTLSSVMKENGLAPGLHTGDLKQDIRMVSGKNIRLRMTDLMSVDSANIYPEDWAAMAKYIAGEAPAVDGIVVIHGTDTMAYTSSMLSFMLQNVPIPVVLTGSQLSIADPVADAMENLRCAIHMAATGFPGVFLAFNRKVMLGCRASKTRSLAFDAFESINYPLVATISARGLSVNESAIPKGKGAFSLRNRFSDEVFQIRLFPGMTPDVFDFLLKRGCRGLYIEAFGTGGMPFTRIDFPTAIKKLIDHGVTVLVGTQCRYEGSDLRIYETGHRILETGALEARDMTGEAAVTKLMWVLGQTKDPELIYRYISSDLCGEMTAAKDAADF